MQKGSSLAEVLISLFLSTLIIASLMQMYLCHKRHYQQFQSDLDMLYDLQQISALMRQSLMSAGFTPCLALDKLTAIDRRADDKTVHALQTATNPSMLHTSRMSEKFYPLLKVTGSRHLLLSAKALVNARHPVLIADCFHAEVHRIDSIEHSPQAVSIQLARPLRFNYQNGSYIGEWIEEKWLVRPNPQGVSSIYLQSRGSEELSSMISAMKLNQNKKLIEVALQTQTQKKFYFVTAMRNG